jgi:hypothetical protein
VEWGGVGVVMGMVVGLSWLKDLEQCAGVPMVAGSSPSISTESTFVLACC